MNEMLDTVYTHGNLVNENTQYICVFNNYANINVGGGLVPTNNE